MKKIQDKFIPYNLALELKHLGFDEPCFATYFTVGAWQIDCTEGALNLKSNEAGEYTILAPLWQDAFRWFREKYQLDSEIYMNHELGVKFYTYLILQLDRAVITHKSGYTGKFNIKEEAELECLKKLIEIVKSQE